MEILARYSPVPLNLFLVPVVPYEMRAIGVITDSYDMVMFRRFMVKTAARLARAQQLPGPGHRRQPGPGRQPDPAQPGRHQSGRGPCRSCGP